MISWEVLNALVFTVTMNEEATVLDGFRRYYEYHMSIKHTQSSIVSRPSCIRARLEDARAALTARENICTYVAIPAIANDIEPRDLHA